MKSFSLPFKVLKKSWKIKVFTKNKHYFKKKSRQDSVAVTYCHKREIDLSPDGLDLETLVHELVHVYRYELCVYSTNEMTLDDQEEFFAELIAKRGQELLDLAHSLLLKIKEARRGKSSRIYNY